MRTMNPLAPRRLAAPAALALLLAPSARAVPQSAPVFRLVDDCSQFNGSTPNAGVMQAADGRLFGVTDFGGAHGLGVVYRTGTDGSGPTDLYDFDGTTGAAPEAPLAQGSDGALYGTTLFGGANNYGTIFKIDPDGSGFTVLASFDDATTGYESHAALLQGSDGMLYGTTAAGGVNGYGTVFTLATDGSGFNVILNFDSATTGAYPSAGLIEVNGEFYGTTSDGGANGGGTLYVLALVHIFGRPVWLSSVLLDFGGATTSGTAPCSTLLLGSDGALYGACSAGGSFNDGVIYQVDTSGAGYAELHDFDGAGGAQPTSPAPLIEAADGALYGTTLYGGTQGIGVVYSLAKDGSNYQVVYDCDYSQSGSNPLGVIEGSDWNLYSVTRTGNGFAGCVFKLVFHVASWTNYGSGLAGTLGVPSFTSTDPVLGTTVQLTVGNSRGTKTSGTLFAGLSQTSIPIKGGEILVGDVFLYLPISISYPSSELDGTLPDDPAVAGTEIDLQVLESDPGAVKKVSFTPGLQLLLGW
jgi:uncharacterized repeat protein (TIGR03803 family)